MPVSVYGLALSAVICWMSFAARALDLLADPATKAPLTAQRGQLVCESTGVAYPVRRGVPDFLQPGPRRRFGRR